MTVALQAKDIRKTFSGIVALDDLDLTVDEGERVGLIGPNGAGKTTFFNCVLGVLRPDSGTVELHGEDVSRLPVHQRVGRGIGRTFQRIELFAELDRPAAPADRRAGASRRRAALEGPDRAREAAAPTRSRAATRCSRCSGWPTSPRSRSSTSASARAGSWRSAAP